MEISHKIYLHNHLIEISSSVILREEIILQMSNFLSCATFECNIESTESQAEGNELQKNA